MNVLIAATVAITVVTAGVAAGQTWPGPGIWGISALKLFALWCLAFLPGWLYVRFLDLRGLGPLFEFPPDMARVPAEVNRLSNQVLVQTFEDEWGKVQR